MKPVHRQTLLMGSLLLGLSTAYPLQAAPLSDFEQFRSYPYMDRSYREAKKGNWKEVERLMRHLLEKVPKNDEARALLVESLANQRRYKEALQALPDNSDALLDLRLTWIEQDPPTSTQVESWMATSSLNDRVRLWQAYSLSLAKFGGAAKAHDWLAQLAPKGDDNILRLARANWSEQLRDWSGTIDQLAPLAARKQLDAEGWQRLANAYVQRLDEKPLQQLLQQAPSPEAARNIRLAMVDRAIAMGHEQQAQRWMQSLPASDLADPAQRQRLWELARKTEDVPTVQRLSNDLQRPCLETAEWLSRQDPEAALKQLRSCPPTDDPQTWLVLAQRLQATDLLQSTRLPEPWDSRRQTQVLDIWQEQGRSAEVNAWLAGQKQTPDIVKRRAELTQRMGRMIEAETLWELHYRQTDNLSSLNQATYLAVNAGDRAHAQQLLESAFDRHNGRLPATALQRLAGLYAAAPSTTPEQQRRMALLLNRVDGATRGQLLAQLAETGQCDAVQQAIGSHPQAAGDYRALGRCAMPDRPGEAVVYYQQAEKLGDRGSRLPLAYALEAAGDSAGALTIWRSIPTAELSDNARLTASRSALNVGDSQTAETYWQQSTTRGANEWALGAAIADARGDHAQALQRQRQALQQAPDAGHFYAASVTAQKAGDLPQSTAWLAEAVRREPNNPRYRADYGMRLAGAETREERATAIPYLQQATRDFPEDYRLGETLAWRYDEVEDSASARKELRRVIDLEQNPVAADGEDGSMEARRYRQRRAHETLSRRDSRTIASTWSPAGISTNDFVRPDDSKGSRRRSDSQNVQLAMWDHALGEEPSRAGSTLSVYGRVLLGGQGRSSYAESLAAGVGLRYKPWGTQNINFYGEIYKQSQFDDDDSHSLSLGQMLVPEKLFDQVNDHRKDGHTTTDYLLRATASFLDQGKYRNDWRVDENDWDERFLYLDAAWWTKAGDHQWLSRFQQGHAWKLPFSGAQTIMPYGFLEFASQDPSNDWRQDLRTGVGLRWQWWYDEDRYNAYRSKLTVRTEYQQSLGGNLYEGGNGVLLGVEWNF
ncbi:MULTISPECIES: NfrA family protein [unclassified Pseudomonas]|uniref:NfrA family protein n=1 Tax=unclassified Pseudomonas TaxID=196821 RepID=UPI000C889A6D|nr:MULTISPECIES: phage receptor [unclassified Pseudomonas]PNA07452.1 phage receptor [Pseudomonas sp. FW305-BF15]PNB78380.1 phage receptor [Pseudomonas sp. FW305-BF6]